MFIIYHDWICDHHNHLVQTRYPFLRKIIFQTQVQEPGPQNDHIIGQLDSLSKNPHNFSKSKRMNNPIPQEWRCPESCMPRCEPWCLYSITMVRIWGSQIIHVFFPWLNLVGGIPWYTYPSEKWWSSSVGMMTFPIYGKKKQMFQTTDQITISCWLNPIKCHKTTILVDCTKPPTVVSPWFFPIHPGLIKNAAQGHRLSIDRVLWDVNVSPFRVLSDFATGSFDHRIHGGCYREYPLIN